MYREDPESWKEELEEVDGSQLPMTKVTGLQ